MIRTRLGRRRLRLVAIIVSATALVLLARWQGWLDGADNFYFDAWHQLAGKRREASHVSIVSVDDDTFLRLKDDPLAFWQPHFATVMKVLEDAGAAVIGLDFVYATSAETWLKRQNLPDSGISRTYDAPFRERLAAGGKVLVGHLVIDSHGEPQLVLPPPEHRLLLPGGAGDIGLANLFPEDDSIVRRFHPVLVSDPGQPGVGFSTLLALKAARQDAAAAAWHVGGVEVARSLERRPIGFVGPPDSVPRVSMARLLEPAAANLPEVRALRGRVVIITAHDSSSLQDTHLTPYSRGLPGHPRSVMTGGEVHANIVETLLSGQAPRAVPQWQEAVLALLAAWVAAVLFLSRHPLAAGLAGIGLALLAAGAGYVAFGADRVLPVATMQFAVIASLVLALASRLTGEERARRRLRAMFGAYVSDEVVEHLIARRGEGERVDLGGEEATVTVLFSDIRNFTTISEKLTPQEVVEMLNSYFARVCEPILREGGNVNKYIGDAVMAIFGSPVRVADHGRRAVRAALGMLDAADDFRQWMESRFAGRGLPEFAIGIGLHTGPVIAGDIGTERRREYTIIGDTVNIASRLEGATKETGWRIVASRATCIAAGEGVVVGGATSLGVKGRAEPVDVVEVRGLAGMERNGVADTALHRPNPAD